MPAKIRIDAVNADTDALVTELIAFVDDHQDQTWRTAAGRSSFGAVRSDGERAALEARAVCLVIAV